MLVIQRMTPPPPLNNSSPQQACECLMSSFIDELLQQSYFKLLSICMVDIKLG